MMASMIIFESGLSFIGMGIPQPTPTWGNMISEAQSIRIFRYHPEAWIPPGLGILVTVLRLTLLGMGYEMLLIRKVIEDKMYIK